ncbi:MAG TPA: hypothetical protein VNA20_17755 [Frankiaceae bacterium]|nr:hypothetical protein [Frankiaceae bacterium]
MALTTVRPRRHRVRCAVAAAGVVLAASAPHAAAGAAPASVAYVVTARGSASVDVALGRGVQIHLGRTRVSGAGTYAGYYVQPLDRRGDQGVGELRMAGYRFASFDHVALPLGDGEAIRAYSNPDARPTARRALPPGRYRLHVIGDTMTVLSLALSGVRSGRRLTAARPSPLSIAWADVTPSGIAGTTRAPAAVADLPVTVASARSLTFLSVYAVRHAAFDEALVAVSSYCLATPGAAAGCQIGDHRGEGPGPPGGSSYVYGQARYAQPPAPSRLAEASASYYGYGASPAGERVAHFEFATPATIDKVVVLAFSLAY